MAYGVMMLKVMSVLYPFKLYPILLGIKFYLELFREHLKTYCMNMNMQKLYIEPTNAFKRTVYLMNGIFLTLFYPIWELCQYDRPLQECTSQV